MKVNLPRLKAALSNVPEDKVAELLELIDEIREAEGRELARTDFMTFVQRVWPGFIRGHHHEIMAEAFERFERGDIKRLIISMPPRHTKPISVDEPVTLGDGREVPLRDIRVGDLVLTDKGRARKVLGAHDQGAIETVKIALANGSSLVAAPDHPILTGFGWVKAGDLTTHHKVKMIPEEMAVGGDTSFCYLAGYLIGDGSIGPCSNGAGQKASFTKSDPELLHHFTGICDSIGVIVKKGSAEGEWLLSGGYVRQATGTHNTFVRDDNFAIREWLRDNDMVHSAAGKRVPDFVKQGTRDQIAAFLGAYFACDGTVARREKFGGVNFSFTTVSEALAGEVHRLLMRLGLYWNLREIKTSVFYKGRHVRGRAWTVGTQSFGEAQKFFNVVAPHVHCEKARRMENELRRGANVKARTNSGYVRVKSVTPHDRAECRCLEVEEDHTFVSAGMVVHNSEFASYLFPAWCMGKDPSRYIMMASHTADLAVGFGRKVKNLLSDRAFTEVFDEVSLSADSKAAGRWNTSDGGAYYAVGVGGAIAGRGADIFIIDDPVSEQDALAAEANPKIFEDVYDWYTSGPRQRLQPGGRICIVMTRWGKGDLAGRVLQAQMQRGGEEWEYIELPAILPSGKALWPEYWSIEELEALKAELPVHKWNAQYMQQPTARDGAILKRENWREWTESDPPECRHIIQSWDTAYTKTTRSDFCACTTWGLFTREDPETGKPADNLILLDSFQRRMEFPELKRVALAHWKQWQPDTFVIEEQAAGSPLIFELRRMGIPVRAFRPTGNKKYGRGTDKVVRATAIADIFESGFVYAPPTRWAEELIEQCAEFPHGQHDDLVDCTVQALHVFRAGGLISTYNDEDWDEEEEYPKQPIRRKYGYHL